MGSRSSELKVSPVWHLLALQRGGEGGGRALSTCAPLCPRRTGLWEGLTHACERSAFHFQHLFKTLCVGLSVSSRDSQKAHSPVGEKNVRYFSTRFAFLAPKDFSLTLFPKLSPSLPSSMKFECHRCTVSILIGLCIPVLSNEESKIFPTLVCQEGLLSALGGLSLRWEKRVTTGERGECTRGRATSCGRPAPVSGRPTAAGAV